MVSIKIVICDDNSTERNEIEKLIRDYIKARSLRTELSVFSSPQSLLENALDADIYLLDIIMPDTDGIELARKIREKNINAAIIYLTSSQEFAIKAFSVRAFSYLLKPIKKDVLYKELDECVKKLRKHYYRAEIKRDNKVMTEVLPLDEIIAVEYCDHRLIYHIMDRKTMESSYKRGSFESIAEFFHNAPGFIKISASYIVNIQHIRQIDGDDFIMSDGSCYRVTRRYMDAKKRYIDFILD